MSEVVLGIESSSDRGSVALVRGGQLLAEVSTVEPNRHAESLLPLTEQLLERTGVAKQEICTIVAGTGPGSFTGLRAGLALATGMGLGLGVPVVGVSSLVILASALRRRMTVASDGKPLAVSAVLDARRDEAFFAAFDQNLEPLVAPCLVRNAALAAFIEEQLAEYDWLAAGAAARTWLPEARLLNAAWHDVTDLAFPSAHEAALLARSKHATLDPLPFYLRDADAKLPVLPRNPLTSVD